MPGIVYNKTGYRIGYGGGYYDRFLRSYMNHTMSLAFECQLSDEVIPNAFDLPVDKIITNKQMIHCKSESRRRNKMNSVYDVMQLLKRFGIYVYTKDRLSRSRNDGR